MRKWYNRLSDLNGAGHLCLVVATDRIHISHFIHNSTRDLIVLQVGTLEYKRALLVNRKKTNQVYFVRYSWMCDRTDLEESMRCQLHCESSSLRLIPHSEKDVKL